VSAYVGFRNIRKNTNEKSNFFIPPPILFCFLPLNTFVGGVKEKEEHHQKEQQEPAQERWRHR
jgi:hypothetical protein